MNNPRSPRKHPPSTHTDPQPSTQTHAPPALFCPYFQLPHEARILCTSFAPPDAADEPHKLVERARALVFATWTHAHAHAALLPYVAVTERRATLHVFAVSSQSAESTAATALHNLALDGLYCTDTSAFDIAQVYAAEHPLFISDETRPRYLMFIAALRDRILSDVCDTTAAAATKHPAVRLRSGFLMPTRPVDGEWAHGWHPRRNPLSYCHLHLQSAADRIYVQPIFRPTAFCTLSAPLRQGSPIALLPHAVPAYYIAPYVGSTAALATGFRDSLVGLGVGDWDARGFLLCWITVENPQGDDKGVVAVWPTALTVSCPDRPPSMRIPPIPEQFCLSGSQPSSSILPDKDAEASPAACADDFRAFTLRRQADIGQVGSSVAEFIDAVAKERDRERERAKEERSRKLAVTVPESSVAKPHAEPAPVMRPSTDQSYPSPPEVTPLAVLTTSPMHSPAIHIPHSATVDSAWAEFPSALPSANDFGMIEDPIVDSLDAFNVFTDDDFNFFDQPDHTLAADLGTGDMLRDAIPAFEAAHMPHQQDLDMDWSAGPPSTFAFPTTASPAALPSPAKTPSEPDPASPALELDGSPPADAFDPIPFGAVHRAADAKYARRGGKFALPSPPPSDRDENDADLRRTYARLTDPRVGTVRRLRRKRKSVDQGFRPSPVPWLRTSEEWLPHDSPSPASSSSSAAPSDSDYSNSDLDAEEGEGQPPPRAPTPVPAAALVGPVLLHARFAHRALLALGMPLGVPPAHPTGPGPPVSVPTPVSPAAGGASPVERARALAPVALALAREAAENPVWARAWAPRTPPVPLRRDEETAALARVVGVPGVCCARDDELWGVAQLLPPTVSVDKGGTIVQVVPSALRFWEKLGLGPRGGAKAVTAFVLFEDGGDLEAGAVSTWLEGMSRAFAARGLGTHTVGETAHHTQGLVPVKWEQIRKTLAAAVTSISKLAPAPPHVVLYIAVPPALMTLASPPLRALLAFAAHALKLPGGVALEPDRTLVHLLPSTAFHMPGLAPWLAGSVYDRVLRPVERARARAFFRRGAPWRTALPAPAAVLAGPPPARVKLDFEWPVRALDVLAAGALFHVAYRATPCGAWLLSAAVDALGEARALTLWPRAGDDGPAAVVQRVWAWAIELTGRASLAWRVVVAKVGDLGRAEIEAWDAHVKAWDAALPASAPRMHFTLLSAQQHAPCAILPVPRAPGLAAAPPPSVPGWILYDTAWAGHALLPRTGAPSLGGPAASELDLHADETRVRAAPDATAGEDDTVGVRPAVSTALLRSGGAGGAMALHVLLLHGVTPAGHVEDVVRSWDALAILSCAQATGRAAGEMLPLHVEALDVMDAALASGELAAEIACA